MLACFDVVVVVVAIDVVVVVVVGIVIISIIYIFIFIFIFAGVFVESAVAMLRQLPAAGAFLPKELRTCLVSPNV